MRELGAACGMEDREQLRECGPEVTCAQESCLSAGQAAFLLHQCGQQLS